MTEPMKQQGAILAFNFAGVRLANLQALCDEYGADLKTVSAKTSPETFSLSLGAIFAGGTVSTSDSLDEDARDILRAMAFDDEMLILAGFDQSTFETLLDDLKKKGLSVPIKAVLTPTNAAWTPVALKAELEGERAAIMEAFAKQQAKAEQAVKPDAEQVLEELAADAAMMEAAVENLD